MYNAANDQCFMFMLACGTASPYAVYSIATDTLGGSACLIACARVYAASCFLSRHVCGCARGVVRVARCP